MIKKTNDSPSLFSNLSDMLNQNVRRPFLSSGGGEGRGGAGRDLSEVDDSLKFILFFFTVKNPGHRSPQVRSRPLRSGCPADFQAVGGTGEPLCCPVFLWFYKILKINKL